MVVRGQRPVRLGYFSNRGKKITSCYSLIMTVLGAAFTNTGLWEPGSCWLGVENNCWTQFHSKKKKHVFISRVVCRLISCLQKWFDIFMAVTISLNGPGHLKHRVWLCIYIYIFKQHTGLYLHYFEIIKIHDVDLKFLASC